MQVLPVVAERGAEARAFEVGGDVAFIDRVAGTRQLATHQFPHPLLQIRKAVETEAIGEAHDRRRVDVELRGHLIDGRERHRLRVLDDVGGDALLRLRQQVVAAAKLLDHVAGTDRFGRELRGSFADRHALYLDECWPLPRRVHACNKIRCSQTAWPGNFVAPAPKHRRIRLGLAYAGNAMSGRPAHAGARRRCPQPRATGSPAVAGDDEGAFGRANAASISRRTFTATSASS